MVIDGVRLHVSKPYLALYSPVFSALFYAEFRERDMEEVPLEDVILEEFTELLQVIYPSHKKVTGLCFSAIFRSINFFAFFINFQRKMWSFY